jgi:putative hydrolase of HD superfamily
MSKEIIEFFKLVGLLKKLPRSGWKTKVGVENPESVADHVFRTAVLAMVFGDLKKLDTEKMIRMALLHELQEIFIGDLIPEEKKRIPKEELRKREFKAMNRILSHLPKNMKNKYLKLWEEFENEKSEEGKVVKDLEKLELVFQALEYEKEGYKKEDLNEFYDSAKSELKYPETKKIFELLIEERPKSKN